MCGPRLTRHGVRAQGTCVWRVSRWLRRRTRIHMRTTCPFRLPIRGTFSDSSVHSMATRRQACLHLWSAFICAGQSAPAKPPPNPNRQVEHYHRLPSRQPTNQTATDSQPRNRALSRALPPTPQPPTPQRTRHRLPSAGSSTFASLRLCVSAFLPLRSSPHPWSLVTSVGPSPILPCIPWLSLRSSHHPHLWPASISTRHRLSTATSSTFASLRLCVSAFLSLRSSPRAPCALRARSA